MTATSVFDNKEITKLMAIEQHTEQLTLEQAVLERLLNFHVDQDNGTDTVALAAALRASGRPDAEWLVVKGICKKHDNIAYYPKGINGLSKNDWVYFELEPLTVSSSTETVEIASEITSTVLGEPELESNLYKSYVTPESVPFVLIPEFENLFSRQSDQEYFLKRESILTEGVREPLSVWRRKNADGTTTDILIDGHQRWEIISDLTKELDEDIPYQTKIYEFSSVEAARTWALKKQVERRNVSDTERIFVLGEIYSQLAPGEGRLSDEKKASVEELKAIASENGKTYRSLQNYGSFYDVAKDFCESLADYEEDGSSGIRQRLFNRKPGDAKKLVGHLDRENLSNAAEIYAALVDDEKLAWFKKNLKGQDNPENAKTMTIRLEEVKFQKLREFSRSVSEGLGYEREGENALLIQDILELLIEKQQEVIALLSQG